jgi:hypothetical protein
MPSFRYLSLILHLSLEYNLSFIEAECEEKVHQTKVLFESLKNKDDGF